MRRALALSLAVMLGAAAAGAETIDVGGAARSYLIQFPEGFGAYDVLRRSVSRNHVRRVPAFGDDAVDTISLFNMLAQ